MFGAEVARVISSMAASGEVADLESAMKGARASRACWAIDAWDGRGEVSVWFVRVKEICWKAMTFLGRPSSCPSSVPSVQRQVSSECNTPI